MTRTAIRLAASVLTAVLAATGAMTYASPASAAEACRTNSKEFPTSGYNADVTVTLCVRSNSSGGHFADGYVRWNEAGSNKFDKFWVEVRLERYDADIAEDTCSMTSAINSLYQGDDFCGIGSYSGGSGGWTADGKVIYNLNNDGKGDFVWSLTGSPVIS